jgi:hypothetical protein
MARFSVQVTYKANGAHVVAPIGDVVNTVATTTVAADVATLVSDGASPTQAHVNTLNTDWTALLAGLGPVPSNADVVLSVNTANVTSRSALRQVLLSILRKFDEGVGALAP